MSWAPAAQDNHYRAFGLALATDVPFPGAWRASPPDDDATVVREQPLPAWSGDNGDGWRGTCDGEEFAAVGSATGEYRFLHGGRELFQLSAEHRRLLCAPSAQRDARWWRVLLDSVLFTTSLLRGNEALHAGAVATDVGVVAIVAGSGVGKSTLLSQLLREGHQLVADDILVLESTHDDVLAHPGPPLITVPRKRAGRLGRQLSDLGEEVWATVPTVRDPMPLRRLVFLDRQPREATAMHPLDRSLSPLMTHLLKFPRTAERERSRFILASAIATRTEMWHLVADMKTSPRQLAAHVVWGLSP